MARILIAWELGAGLGHVRRLLSVAVRLAEHGHQPIFAMRNLVEPWQAIQEAGFPVLQAPTWHPRPLRPGWKAAGITDIIAMQGFGDPNDLLPIIQAWQSIIDIVQPALIVSDYSPTICLTAFGVEPMIIVGDGFTTPPHHLESVPLLRPNLPITLGQDRMLEVIREVQRRRGRPQPDTFPQIFRAEAVYICTLPELDPYRDFRLEPAIGPFEPPPTPCPATDKQKFFAYIASDYRKLKPAAEGITAIKLPGEIFIRRAPEALKSMFRDAGLFVYDKPAPLAEVLAQSSVLVHHGGIGTTETALGIGRPQVLLPRHMEQNETAKALKALGVGIAVAGNFKASDVADAVFEVSNDGSFQERALAFAATLQARGPFDNVQRIVDGCCRFISIGRAEPVF